MGIDNTTVARRITFDLFQSGDLTLLDSLVTRDFRNEGQTDGPTAGRENLATAIRRVRSAFPDTLEHEVADGDLVLHHLRAQGTHRGQLRKYAATDKPAAWREMHLSGFAADVWSNSGASSIA